MLKLIKEVYQNYFEIASAISAVLIIAIAYALDQILFLQACAMCILTRYAFGLVFLTSLISHFFKNKLSYFAIMLSSLAGIFITSRQIYIQNLSVDELSQLGGCGMPFHTIVEYFGVIEGIKKTLNGGPSCAEDGMRFIFNFAEWGLIFFLVYFFLTLKKIFKS